MEILINGKKENLDNKITILDILKMKNIRKEIVEVELNGDIIKKESYDKTFLKEKDVLEFIFYMGGGEWLQKTF